MNVLDKNSVAVGEAVSFPRDNPTTEIARWEANSLPYRASFENRRNRTTSSCLEMFGKIDKKRFRGALDEDVDLTVTAETPAGIERHDRGLSALQNIACAQGDFFFETPAAERTDGTAIFANEHARTWSSVTRTFYAHERGQRKSAARFEIAPDLRLKLAQDVINIFHG